MAIKIYNDNVRRANAVSRAQDEAADAMLRDPTDDYIESVDTYRDMDVDTFCALPYQERLLYAQFLIDQTVERGNYDEAYGPGSPGSSFSIAPAKIALDNTDQEVLDGYLYVSQIAFLQIVESEEVKKRFDPSDGQKVLSRAYFDVGSGGTRADTYLNQVGMMELKEYPSYLVNRPWTATAVREIRDGVDSSGLAVRYRDIAYRDGEDPTMRARFVYWEFQSYDGGTHSAWLLESNAIDQVTLEAHSTIR